jgi:hypothetical protein
MDRMLMVLLGMQMCSSSLQAQVVQLPSMRQFSIETTVLVPDSGGAYLGGVNRSYLGRSARGTPGLGRLGGNYAISSETHATGAFVRATIIDHAELDEHVLAVAKSKRSLVLAPETELPTKPSRDEAPLPSLRSIRTELAAEDARLEAAAEEVYQKALACEERGEWRLARTYYQLAAQKSPSLVKAKAETKLAALRLKIPSQLK